MGTTASISRLAVASAGEDGTPVSGAKPLCRKSQLQRERRARIAALGPAAYRAQQLLATRARAERRRENSTRRARESRKRAAERAELAAASASASASSSTAAAAAPVPTSIDESDHRRAAQRESKRELRALWKQACGDAAEYERLKAQRRDGDPSRLTAKRERDRKRKRTSMEPNRRRQRARLANWVGPQRLWMLSHDPATLARRRLRSSQSLAAVRRAKAARAAPNSKDDESKLWLDPHASSEHNADTVGLFISEKPQVCVTARLLTAANRALLTRQNVPLKYKYFVPASVFNQFLAFEEDRQRILKLARPTHTQVPVLSAKDFLAALHLCRRLLASRDDADNSMPARRFRFCFKNRESVLQRAFRLKPATIKRLIASSDGDEQRFRDSRVRRLQLQGLAKQILKARLVDASVHVIAAKIQPATDQDRMSVSKSNAAEDDAAAASSGLSDADVDAGPMEMDDAYAQLSDSRTVTAHATERRNALEHARGAGARLRSDVDHADDEDEEAPVEPYRAPAWAQPDTARPARCPNGATVVTHLARNRACIDGAAALYDEAVMTRFAEENQLLTALLQSGIIIDRKRSMPAVRQASGATPCSAGGSSSDAVYLYDSSAFATAFYLLEKHQRQSARSHGVAQLAEIVQTMPRLLEQAFGESADGAAKIDSDAKNAADPPPSTPPRPKKRKRDTRALPLLQSDDDAAEDSQLTRDNVLALHGRASAADERDPEAQTECVWKSSRRQPLASSSASVVAHDAAESMLSQQLALLQLRRSPRTNRGYAADVEAHYEDDEFAEPTDGVRKYIKRGKRTRPHTRPTSARVLARPSASPGRERDRGMQVNNRRQREHAFAFVRHSCRRGRQLQLNSSRPSVFQRAQ